MSNMSIYVELFIKKKTWKSTNIHQEEETDMMSVLKMTGTHRKQEGWSRLTFLKYIITSSGRSMAGNHVRTAFFPKIYWVKNAWELWVQSVKILWASLHSKALVVLKNMPVSLHHYPNSTELKAWASEIRHKMVHLQILNKWKTGHPAVFEKESSYS